MVREWEEYEEIELAVTEFRRTGNTVWLDNIVYDQCFCRLIGDEIALPKDILLAIELEGL